MKTFEQIKLEINQKLKDNPLLSPAIGLAEYFIGKYTKLFIYFAS